MNYDIETATEWTLLDDLTDEAVYFLQGKHSDVSNGQKKWFEKTFLYTQTDTEPTEESHGILVSSIKFDKKAGKNVYIKAISLPLNIQIEEV